MYSNCIALGFEKWIGYADLKHEPTYYGMPKSCADLRGIGHTSFSSGMYSIMGQKFVEVVYCDFTKSQNEQGLTIFSIKSDLLCNQKIYLLKNVLGFQKWLGYADLKAEPTYFGMPKSCADLRGIGHTTFSSGLYPILGEKFVEMVYCDFDKSSNGNGNK
jgi:hypothetical protein